MGYGGGGGGGGSGGSGGSGGGGAAAGAVAAGISGGHGGTNAYKMKFMGNRGVFAGGAGPVDTIEYITISTPGNATDFAELTSGRVYMNGGSNGYRGVFGGGAPSPPISDTIAYITISVLSDALDFGEISEARFGYGTASSDTRCLFSSGYNGSTNIDSKELKANTEKLNEKIGQSEL